MENSKILPAAADLNQVHESGAERNLSAEAIKLRHPWRMVFAIVIILAAGLFIYDAAVNRPVYNWELVGKYVFDARIVIAAGYTLQLTVYSMVIAIVLGILVAIMRLSPNVVVKSVAWFYLWVFRGTPVYVQLVFWGLVPTIYKTIVVGVPFTEFVTEITTQDLLNYFTLAVIGLALNESSYMAEIVRAGLLSVDKGQHEAATALGLGWGHTMAKVVLPQAMRVIIPPTGNEVISMLKTTSLVTGVPLTLELYGSARDISARIYEPVALLIVASLWYLLVTSVLMVGQFYVERYFSKGVADRTKVMRQTVETNVIPVVGELAVSAAEKASDSGGSPGTSTAKSGASDE